MGLPSKTVSTVVERNGKSFWTKIGVGFVNRDGSLTLQLDALPVNGKLIVRDYVPGERSAVGPGGSGASRAGERASTSPPEGFEKEPLDDDDIPF